MTSVGSPCIAQPGFDQRLTSAAPADRDTQIAARHADPRTTMRYDRARTNLHRHANYVVAAHILRHLNRTNVPMSGSVMRRVPAAAGVRMVTGSSGRISWTFGDGA